MSATGLDALVGSEITLHLRGGQQLRGLLRKAGAEALVLEGHTLSVVRREAVDAWATEATAEARALLLDLHDDDPDAPVPTRLQLKRRASALSPSVDVTWDAWDNDAARVSLGLLLNSLSEALAYVRDTYGSEALAPLRAVRVDAPAPPGASRSDGTFVIGAKPTRGPLGRPNKDALVHALERVL